MEEFIQKMWRPAGGWVCVMTIAYAGFGHGLLNWAMHIYSVRHDGPVPTFEALDHVILFEIIGVMLTLGGYRTYEKIKAVSPVPTEVKS